MQTGCRLGNPIQGRNLVTANCAPVSIHIQSLITKVEVTFFENLYFAQPKAAEKTFSLQEKWQKSKICGNMGFSHVNQYTSSLFIF